MNKIKELLLKNPLIWVIILLIAMLPVAFIAGKSYAPKDIQIVEKQVVVEKEKLKIVEVEKVIVEKAADTTLNKSIHKERREETKPDGTKIVTEIVDINVDKVVKETEVKFVDRTNTVEKQVVVEKKVEVEKIVKTPLPDWTVTARAGVDANKLLKPELGYSPVVIGAEVDRRIIGPFKAGLWVNTTTTFNSWQGGIAVSGEF